MASTARLSSAVGVHSAVIGVHSTLLWSACKSVMSLSSLYSLTHRSTVLSICYWIGRWLGRIFTEQKASFFGASERVQSLCVRRRGCVRRLSLRIFSELFPAACCQWRVYNSLPGPVYGETCAKCNVRFRLAPESHFRRSELLEWLRVCVLRYLTVWSYFALFFCLKETSRFHYLLRSVSTSRRARKSRIQSVQSRLSKLKQK